MDGYSFNELVDMQLMYSLVYGNSHRATQLYQETLPNRCQPHHITFATIYHWFRETGTLKPVTVDWGRQEICADIWFRGAYPRPCWRSSECEHERTGERIKSLVLLHLQSITWTVTIPLPFTSSEESHACWLSSKRGVSSVVFSTKCWSFLYFGIAVYREGNFWYRWNHKFS